MAYNQTLEHLQSMENYRLQCDGQLMDGSISEIQNSERIVKPAASYFQIKAAIVVPGK
jgi:hypothetical protein